MSFVLPADEIPDSDLLTPVIGPVPVQERIEINCMLLPLPALLDHALSLPLLTQYAYRHFAW